MKTMDHLLCSIVTVQDRICVGTFSSDTFFAFRVFNLTVVAPVADVALPAMRSDWKNGKNDKMTRRITHRRARGVARAASA